MKESDVALLVVTKDAPVSTIAVVRTSGLPQGNVIVVSNASCDKAEAEIKKALPDITFVQVRPGRGLTYCWNVGLRLPAQVKWAIQPTWTIMSNDDVEFDSGWFVKFGAGVLEHPNARHIALSYPKNRYSCFAVHRELVRDIGWFDERFTGMFYEDDDWHLRLGEYAKIPWGTRVHEKDKDGIFAALDCARHDDRLHKLRAADRKRFGFVSSLCGAPNKKFYYEKWKVVEKDGWQGKGLKGRFARQLPEVEWYPRSLMEGVAK